MYMGIGKMHLQVLSRIFVTLSLPLESDRYRCKNQHLEPSNILSFQALHSFWFIANELQTRSLYLCLIENAHVFTPRWGPRVWPLMQGVYSGTIDYIFLCEGNIQYV